MFVRRIEEGLGATHHPALLLGCCFLVIVRPIALLRGLGQPVDAFLVGMVLIPAAFPVRTRPSQPAKRPESGGAGCRLLQVWGEHALQTQKVPWGLALPCSPEASNREAAGFLHRLPAGVIGRPEHLWLSVYSQPPDHQEIHPGVDRSPTRSCCRPSVAGGNLRRSRRKKLKSAFLPT